MEDLCIDSRSQAVHFKCHKITMYLSGVTIKMLKWGTGSGGGGRGNSIPTNMQSLQNKLEIKINRYSEE